VGIERARHTGNQTAQVGPESGGQNDCIEWLRHRIGKDDAIGREAIDAAAYPDRAVPDLGKRTDIDQRHASVLLDHLPWSLDRAPQSQFFDVADREPQHRRVDDIDQPRRQPPVQDRPGQNRKAE
jgi:hypothetical protein